MHDHSISPSCIHPLYYHQPRMKKRELMVPSQWFSCSGCTQRQSLLVLIVNLSWLRGLAPRTTVYGERCHCFGPYLQFMHSGMQSHAPPRLAVVLAWPRLALQFTKQATVSQVTNKLFDVDRLFSGQGRPLCLRQCSFRPGVWVSSICQNRNPNTTGPSLKDPKPKPKPSTLDQER